MMIGPNQAGTLPNQFDPSQDVEEKYHGTHNWNSINAGGGPAEPVEPVNEEVWYTGPNPLVHYWYDNNFNYSHKHGPVFGSFERGEWIASILLDPLEAGADKHEVLGRQFFEDKTPIEIITEYIVNYGRAGGYEFELLEVKYDGNGNIGRYLFIDEKTGVGFVVEYGGRIRPVDENNKRHDFGLIFAPGKKFVTGESRPRPVGSLRRRGYAIVMDIVAI